jgi:release factor glutamine methyltransferase
MTPPHPEPPTAKPGLVPEITVAAAMAALTATFRAAGIDTPGLDARRLLEAVACLTPEAIILNSGRPLSTAEAGRLAELSARRVAREPVSRILGQRSFYGRTFQLTPETLDPRPDTETLVEMALALVREAGSSGNGLRILDIGTGTGAILLTLLAEIEGATGLGTDVSTGALDVARRNAEALGLSARVDWRLARSLEGIDERFGLVVSNPPYIVSADVPCLDPEVREYDPHVALDGGADGMDVVREIAAGAGMCTGNLGWCVIEIGAGQAATATEIIQKHRNIGGVSEVRVARDLGGHIRCVAWQPHF